MEITLSIKLLLAIIIAIIIGIIVAISVNRCNDAKVGIGCGMMFPIVAIVFVALQIAIPDVIVISSDNTNSTNFSHETKSIYPNIKIFNGEEVSLSLCSRYIYNDTDEPLILYPEYYGQDSKANSYTPAEPLFLEPKSVIKIGIIPDYYFSTAPEQISSKSSSIEVRWVLESLRTVAEREGWEL